MPTSPYFPSYYGGTTGEQGLVQDLVDEQIKLFGTDIYYLPRTLITDGVLDDVIYNKFESQFQVEMLLQNVEGFGSPSEFISKFGLRITDEVRFVVSQRRWEDAAAGYRQRCHCHRASHLGRGWRSLLPWPERGRCAEDCGPRPDVLSERDLHAADRDRVGHGRHVRSEESQGLDQEEHKDCLDRIAN